MTGLTASPYATTCRWNPGLRTVSRLAPRLAAHALSHRRASAQNRWGYTHNDVGYPMNVSLALYPERDVNYLVGQNDTCNDARRARPPRTDPAPTCHPPRHRAAPRRHRAAPRCTARRAAPRRAVALRGCC